MAGLSRSVLSHDIFTPGNTWEELRRNVREAVAAYFFDQPKLSALRPHLVRDEVLARSSYCTVSVRSLPVPPW